MKKYLCATLCLVLAVAILALVVPQNNAFAEEAAKDFEQTEEYKFLTDFTTNCRDRFRPEDEANAAQYLKGKFDELLAVADTQSKVDKFGSANEEQFYNVIAKLEGQNKNKQIIIGAHFDAVGEGANDNGSGVTALYFIMKTLVAQRSQLPCNVVFAAFGGEERGLLGSTGYVNRKMSSAEIDDTLLMVNIDSISNGDNLYLFCENKKTTLAELILQNSDDSVSEKSHVVGTYPMDVYGYGYYESIQASDYTPFRLAGIPTAFFFSGNFVGWNYVESTTSNKNTMNTNSDTLENLHANGAVVVERIQSVTNSVCKTLMCDGFMSVAENARSELMNNKLLFNAWWPRLLVIGLLAICTVLAVFYFRKLQKKAIMGTAEVKSQQVFAKPEAKDIFSFDDKKGGSDSKKDDTDDIFTFKK